MVLSSMFEQDPGHSSTTISRQISSVLHLRALDWSTSGEAQAAGVARESQIMIVSSCAA